jgi:hypothetical protein
MLVWHQYEPHTYLHGDGAFYANINKALWHDGTIEQTNYHPHSWLEDDLGWNRNLDQGWSNVSLGRDGRWMPKHSYVLPLFSTPFYAAFGLTGLLLFHLLMMVLLVVASYGIAARFISPACAAVATFLVAAQPVLRGELYAYNNDAFISALLALAVWTFLHHRLIASGALFGIAVWAKATNLLFVLPFAIWLLWRRDRGQILRGLGAFLVPVFLWLGSNAWFYGGPLTTSYSNILVRTNGQLTTEGIEKQFDEPLKDGLDRILNNERQGLIPQAPLLLLALLGAFWMLTDQHQRALGAAYLSILGLFLILHAKYAYTYGRFFLPVVGISVLPLGALLERGSRWLDRLAPKREGISNRLFAVAIAALISLVVLLSFRLNPPTNARWSAVDTIEKARVFDGKKVCDYFNNLHQKFECHRDKPYQQWGVDLQRACTFDGSTEPMLWLHPQPRTQRTITFELPQDTSALELTYGLADTSRFNDMDFSVLLDSQRVELPTITSKGALYKTQIQTPAGEHTLTVEVGAQRGGWRHFCFQAMVAE